jgi:uncharacterized membrane protein
MKKLIIVLLLGILIAGSVFAQWGNGYNQTAQTLQTITGTLQIINGILAIVNASNQVYYVPNLQPYYGVNGMYVNTTVTVYGNITNNNYFDPYRFMVFGTWYNFPVYNYYYAPPPQTMYIPPPPRYYHGRYGSCGMW